MPGKRPPGRRPAARPRIPPGEDPPAPELPPPPTRQALAKVLVLAATDAAIIADRPGREIGWGVQWFDVVAPRARLWGLSIWWAADGRLGQLAGAVAPGGGRWSPGCDRWPCWAAGADSVVLEPIPHLLSEGQRERLRERLWDCCCWPPPEHPAREPVKLLPPVVEGDWWELLPS